jgi:hypothetical protein
MIASLLVAGACGDDDDDRAGPVVVIGDFDSGAADAAEPDDGDAGGTDDDGGTAAGNTVLPNECENVNPIAARNEDIPEEERRSSLSTPQDFSVTRAVGAWDATDCDDPKFVITLSEGICPKGRGQSLTFVLSANALQAGAIAVGDNMLVPDGEATAISVRYSRTPTAPVYGTCEGVTGLITFTSTPELTRGSSIFGRFQMDLSDCTEDGMLLPKSFVGAFNVNVRRSRSEVCK